MERFAKVFEAHGRQLLIKKSVDDQSDQPKLSLILQFEEAEMDLGICFPDTDEGTALRDKAFDEYDQAKADAYLEPIKDCASAFQAATILMKGDKRNG